MTNTSSKVPYIIAGSAIGGAIGYFLMTDAGARLRRDIRTGGAGVLPDKIDEARCFLEKKGRVVTDQVRNVLNRAKDSMEAGQEAYEQAGEKYQSMLQGIKTRNTDIASTVQKSIDGLSQTASTAQQSVLDPVYEVIALAKAFDRGVRRFIGKTGEVVDFDEQTGGGKRDRQTPYYKDERVTG